MYHNAFPLASCAQFSGEIRVGRLLACFVVGCGLLSAGHAAAADDAAGEQPEVVATPAAKPAELHSTAWERLVETVEFLRIISETRPVPEPLLPRGTLMSVSAYLNPEAIELLRKRLTDPDSLVLLRQQAPELADLVPLLSALAPLLREIHPEVQFIVARPSFEHGKVAIPEPVLPGLALVFTPVDVAQAKSRLLATYWGVLAGANQQAKQRGESVLRMESERRGEGFFASAYHPAPTQEAARSPLERARFNFMPTVGIADGQFILASNRALGSKLVDLAQARGTDRAWCAGPRLDVGPVAGALLALDNLDAAQGAPSTRANLAAPGAVDTLSLLRGILSNLPQRPLQLGHPIRPLRQRPLGRRGEML